MRGNAGDLISRHPIAAVAPNEPSDWRQDAAHKSPDFPCTVITLLLMITAASLPLSKGQQSTTLLPAVA